LYLDDDDDDDDDADSEIFIDSMQQDSWEENIFSVEGISLVRIMEPKLRYDVHMQPVKKYFVLIILFILRNNYISRILGIIIIIIIKK